MFLITILKKETLTTPSEFSFPDLLPELQLGPRPLPTRIERKFVFRDVGQDRVFGTQSRSIESRSLFFDPDDWRDDGARVGFVVGRSFDDHFFRPVS